MTLDSFTTLTARIPDNMLRGAIAAALASGVPRTPEEFSRFHDDVVDELRLAVYHPGGRSRGATGIDAVNVRAIMSGHNEGASECPGAA